MSEEEIEDPKACVVCKKSHLYYGLCKHKKCHKCCTCNEATLKKEIQSLAKAARIPHWESVYYGH